MVTDRDGENDGEGRGPPPLSSSSLQKPLLTPVTSITLTSVTLASIEKNKSSTNHKNNANGDEDDVSASNEDEMIALKAKLSASPRTSGNVYDPAGSFVISQLSKYFKSLTILLCF